MSYAFQEIINLQNVGSWNSKKFFPKGNINAKSFQNVQKYEIFIL